MEIFGALFDEECESFNTMFNNPKIFKHERSFTFPWDNIFSNIDYFNPHSQESCDGTGVDTPALFGISDNNANYFHDHLCVDNTFESMGFYDGLILADHAMEETLNSARNKSEDFSPECPKKKPRVSYINTQKSKRKKKVMEDKSNGNEEGIENISIGNSKQILLSGSTSDRISNGCLNPDGKARGSRGSATDPQSLYARRRRERISERLRILQNLVPNGTKVDISTMLEEAVHYVKFLQLQIKLLSSDDMWMYAPIANNGMELGMFHKISTNLMG